MSMNWTDKSSPGVIEPVLSGNQKRPTTTNHFGLSLAHTEMLGLITISTASTQTYPYPNLSANTNDNEVTSSW